MGYDLPEFLPATRPPYNSIFDPDQVLPKANVQAIQTKLEKLEYSALVVILPKKHDYADIRQLADKIAKSWGVKDNEILFLVDLESKQLDLRLGPSFSNRGISVSVSNSILDTKFIPAASRGDYAEGIIDTLVEINERYSTSGSWKRQHQQSENSVSSHSSASLGEKHSNYSDLSTTSGVLFVFIAISIVINLLVKRKGENEIDLRKSRELYNKRMDKIIAIYREKPREFIIRVFALICLGYIYFVISVVVIITLILVNFILIFKFPFLFFIWLVPLVVLLGVVVRSLWVNSVKIQGIKLDKSENPQVFDFVEDVRSALDAPPIHEIYLNSECNASILQQPRLGLFGWNKNILFLGIQLLKVCSPDEIRSFVAHELGHLIEGHSTKSARIYSVQCVWFQLMQNLKEDQSIASRIFGRFFNWFVPLLNAYTFPYRREQELSADQLSAKLIGAQSAANSLLALGVKDYFLNEHYWSKIGNRYSSPEVPAVYSNLSMVLKTQKQEEGEFEACLQAVLDVETDYEDSHPSTKERVAAILEVTPQEVKDYAYAVLDKISRVDHSAFDSLFPENGDKLCAVFDQEYKELHSDYWLERHQNYNTAMQEIELLQDKRNNGTLSDRESFDLAYISLTLHGLEQSLDYFKEAIERNPDNSALNKSYGSFLMQLKDPDCVIYLEAAMKLDRLLQYECSKLLYSFFKSNKDEERANYYENMMIDWTEEYLKRQNDIAEIRKDDIFIEHDLSETISAVLADAFSEIIEVKSVYLVRKKVKFIPEIPCYIFVIEYDKKHVRNDEDKARWGEVLQEAILFLNILSGDLIVSYREIAPKNLINAVGVITNAVIYEKKWS